MEKRIAAPIDKETVRTLIAGDYVYITGTIYTARDAAHKGKRTKEVLDAVVRNQSVYFAAVGGAGALLSKCIRSSEVIAYEDLGTEAIRKLYVEDFPVIVVADCKGNNLYETAIEKYRNA